MRLFTSSHGLRKTVAFVVALLLSVLSAVQHTGSALAFAPKNWISTVLSSIDGLVAVRFQTHQSITESAIRELDAEFFRKPTTTKSMEKAIERIVEANAKVDDDQTQSALHFDGENFVEGQARLNLLSQNIVKSLQAGSEAIDVGIARDNLGAALHTLQDFYAHTNWIEMGNRAPHPDLGRPFRAIDQAQPNEPTCVDCTGDPTCPICVDNLITKKLTSGYFGGEDRKRPVIIGPSLTKCIHGGIKDSLQPGAGPTIGGINKDVPDCRISPHSNLHFEAAAVAKEATKRFIRDLKAQLTPRQLRNLLGAGSTLALVIDTTGSMGPIIAGVKDEAIAIVNQRLNTDEEPADYVLVPYNDPDFGPLTITDDPDKFKSAISALGANGGGDCPEPAMQAVLAGLAASDEGGVLFYFTDADIKDKGLVGKVVSLAKSKEIKVYPTKFGKCPSSSSPAEKAGSGPNEQTPQSGGLLAADLPSDDPDTLVANGSGGQVFFLQPSEAGKITKLANFLVRTNAVDLLSLADTLSGTARTYTVPVDSTMTQVTFSVSGTTSVILKRPNGSTVQSTDSGVTVVSASGGVVYSITGPSAGTWSVTVNGSGTFSITVSGESPLELNSFRFMELGGRPGHDGYFAIKGLPIAGQSDNVMAQISGEPSSADFEFRSKKGEVLQKFKLSRGSGVSALLFYGEVTPPNQEFLVYVTGQDASGTAYQRALSTAIKAQTIRITTPLSQDLAPGQTTTYVFTVKNLGPAGTFRFSGSDEKGYLRNINPTQFTLSNNQTVDVAVQLQAPANAVPGSSDTLTVTVESTTSDANNFTVVTSAVTGETTLNFPILKSTNDLFTGLAFLNLGSEKASLTVTAFDENGAALSGTTNPSTLALAASQQLARVAPELFTFAARDNNGWILVKSDKNTVVGFELLGNANVLDGVAATSLSSTALVLTDAELDSTYTTEVHLVNPKSSDSKVTLELHDSSGNQTGKIDFSIPAKGKISKRIQDIFPAISRPFAGYLIARGDNQILAAELLLSDQSIAALNGQLLQEGSSTPTQLFSAQLASGQGLFYTILNLVNPTSKAATVVVRAVGEDGSNLAAPFNISLNPGQQFRRDVGQMFGFNPSALTSGSLVIESSISGLVGDISFGDPSRSNNFRSSLPLDAAPSTSAVFAHVANAAGFFTGVAMVNSNRATANVDVKVFRPDQSLVGASRVVVPANGRRSKLLIEIVSASAGQAGGYFTLDSDQPISSFALFGSTTLTFLAAIPAQRLQAGGTQNPVPTIAGISPSSVTAGSAAFTLTVDGTNFISGSTVQWNGSNRVTTFVSSTRLTAALPAADVAMPGTATVTVFNPAPGGGQSNAQIFTIKEAGNPAPTISSISPTSATAGGAAFTLTVNGTDFVNGAVIRWNGSDRLTTFVNSTQLTASIAAADIASAGTASVTVFNPTPGGGISNALTFTIGGGTAPTINDVKVTSLSNDSAKVDVQLSDPDGDIVKLEFTWYRQGAPGAVKVLNSPADVNLAGVKSGTISYTFTGIGVPTPFGTVSPDRVDVQATDARGLKSNVFSKSF